MRNRRNHWGKRSVKKGIGAGSPTHTDGTYRVLTENYSKGESSKSLSRVKGRATFQSYRTQNLRFIAVGGPGMREVVIKGRATRTRKALSEPETPTKGAGENRREVGHCRNDRGGGQGGVPSRGQEN